MNYVKHFFKRGLCVKNICIDESRGGLTPALVCRQCNREIGFMYFDGDAWKVFIYARFKRYKFEIERWVYEYTKGRNHMGDSSKQGWEEVLHNIKQWREDGVLSVGCEEWDGECKEDSESYEPIGSGEKYENVADELCVIQGHIAQKCIPMVEFESDFHYQIPVL